MNTGVLPYRRKITKRRNWTMGTAICLMAAFALGWSVHAQVGVTNTNAGLVAHAPIFSPNGGARDAIRAHIDQAKHEILIALYYFTDPVLAESLIAAHCRGVSVRVILDRSQKTGRHSQAKRLSDVGIEVHFDTRHRILHHKFMVVDNQTVITGSQNWTKSAETINAENTLILEGYIALVKNYRQEFCRLVVE